MSTVLEIDPILKVTTVESFVLIRNCYYCYYHHHHYSNRPCNWGTVRERYIRKTRERYIRNLEGLLRLHP